MHTLIDYKAKGSLSGLEFNFYNSQEILKLSVKEITNPQSLDRLLNPIPNGLYDLALGPTDKNDICLTCQLDYISCPGHFGHINLVLPVFNPVFFKELIKLMRMSCHSCGYFLTTKFEKDYFYALMTIVNHGLINKIHLVRDLYSKLLNNTDENLLAKISFRKEFHDLLLDILTKASEENLNNGDAYDNCVKNVVKEKIEIVKEFCDVKLKKHKQTCPNCSMPLRQLRAEHNAKLFYAKGVSKRQIRKSETKRILKRRKLLNEDELEPIDLDLDETTAAEGVDVDELDEKAKKLTIDGKSSVESEKLDSLAGQLYVTPSEASKFLTQLVENEKEIIELMYGITNDINNDRDILSLFFFERISVPPSKFRPISQFKEQKFENAQTVQLSKTIRENMVVKDILDELVEAEKMNQKSVVESASKVKRAQERLQISWLNLQTLVNCLYDSELDKINKDIPNGLKQLLEKKEGLFRKHMMGKRVNYAGRSVISPDLYIGTDEIGIPEVFAKKLTYPQPVNSINFWEMRQLVLNGPDIYPGATFVQFGNGQQIKLNGKDYESRLAIAKQLLTPESSIDSNLDIKIVHRHLRNNDILLFNRQPTLHRNSIMAHKARVLTNEKTLRLHYSNCKAYNADFDGDEMNAHLPQNELARAEAYNLMAASEHYLVPKDGTPLGGLIHDHIIGGVMLTIRGRYFNRSDYQMLVYNAFGTFNGKMKFLPPAILKPCELWTGKQVVSTMLVNLLPSHKGTINLDGKTKIGEKTWFRAHDERKVNWSNQTESSNVDHMSETSVIIRDSHLLCGVIDKAHCGSSLYSLVHCCYELYGGQTAANLLTNFGKLFTAFLQFRGFTLGVEDILLVNETRKPMKKLLKKSNKCGNEALARVFHTGEAEAEDGELLRKHYMNAHLSHDESYMKEIDLAYKGAVDGIQNKLVNLCFPSGLIKRFPYNNLQLMIQSGAKGSTVNSMQMSCLLGQQELEGRRPRLMPNGNTLPSFLPYDSRPNSGGFICNSFMSGLTPQEYFFHCMAGREGLVDTAVKTSRSGYLQRCLVKHLEGIVVNYDLTVRDSDGSVIQFQYGEDSLAVEKTQFLNDKQFPFLISNYPIITSNRDEMEKIRSICYHDLVEKSIKKIKDWKKESKKFKDCDDQSLRVSPFVSFSREMASHPQIKEQKFNDRCKSIKEEWKILDDEKRKIFKKGKFKHRLPITVDFNPDRYLGAISEQLQDTIDKFASKNETFFTNSSKYSRKTSLSYDLDTKAFHELIYLKTLKSCVTPGHCVGVLAAQSIGEPSTQMTLNTFHFAGRGDMNVTLGIPRLREILMVASSKIKTPSMEIPLKNNAAATANREDNINKLKNLFNRIMLWDCLHEISIKQELQIDTSKTDRERTWLTKVKFKFIPEAELNQKLNTNIKLYELLNYMETKFFKQLCISINKKYSQISASDLLHTHMVRDKAMRNFQNINPDGEDNDGIDQDDLNELRESGEAGGEKLLNKVNDELEYVGEEEEKNEIGEVDEDDNNEEEDDGLLNETVKTETENGSDNENEVKIEVKKLKKKKIDQTRINHVLNVSTMVDSYMYDSERKEWCELTLKLDAVKPRIDLYSILQKDAKNSFIAKIENIKRSFISQSTLPEDNGCFKMITEGINVKAVIKNSDLLDISKLYLNDIHMMASTFGIEAAVKVIVREMKQVFNAYGIHVDYRHLSLIADYMTFEGVYKPFNRIGIKTNASPLQKMSFETCLSFFKDACLLGQKEKLVSPSSCIVTGRMCKVGTGIFDVVTKLV